MIETLLLAAFGLFQSIIVLKFSGAPAAFFSSPPTPRLPTALALTQDSEVSAVYLPIWRIHSQLFLLQGRQKFSVFPSNSLIAATQQISRSKSLIGLRPT
jgi:hypothetical protein